MQNSVLRSRMTIVYWAQPSSLPLYIQNSDFSIRITSLYGSQPSFVAFACATAALGPEFASLYGSLTSPVVLCMQNSVISISITRGPSPQLWFWIQNSVSMGSSPHMWFCEIKTSGFWRGITNLYESQT